MTVKKTKNLYNDQTYESIKKIMSYSQQVFNKNATVFFKRICLSRYKYLVPRPIDVEFALDEMFSHLCETAVSILNFID